MVHQLKNRIVRPLQVSDSSRPARKTDEQVARKPEKHATRPAAVHSRQSFSLRKLIPFFVVLHHIPFYYSNSWQNI